MTAIIRTQNLSFSYSASGQQVLHDISFDIEPGEMVAITGASGSGKSTLFYLLGGLAQPTAGEVYLENQALTSKDDLEMAEYRNRTIGFVFQQFHLLQQATVFENLLLPANYPAELSKPEPKDTEHALALAEKLGIGSLLDRMTNELSGGQQQRVAVARALMRNPRIILADEPTGNLDSKNSASVLQILKELNQEGKTVVIITHDPEVAKMCSRRIEFRDGRISNDNGQGRASSLAVIRPPAIGRTQSNGSYVWRLALQNVARQKVKSLLTVLGVIIGVAAVLAMISVGRYTQARVLEGFDSLGVNRLVINGSRNWRRMDKKQTMTFSSFSVERDLEPLREIFPEINLMSPMMMNWGLRVVHAGKTVTEGMTLLGLAPEYFRLANMELAEGRFFSTYNTEMAQSVCLLGAGVAMEIVSQGPVLGATINVGFEGNPLFPCRVVGILKTQKSAVEWFQPDKQVFIPYTYYRTIASIWQRNIERITLNVNPRSDVQEMATKIRSFFELKYGDGGTFSVDDNATMVYQMRRFLAVFTILLSFIAFLSLLVGGIGIHNMMLVAVSERLREIGLRKALGATVKSIRRQFLAESIILCAGAGVVGLLVGAATFAGLVYGATFFVKTLKFEWTIDPIAGGVAILSIVAVGVLSGLMPARRAEKLSIIDALRSD